MPVGRLAPFEAGSPSVRTPPSVNRLTFALYIAFLVEFFLHLSVRIPGLGLLRPTLLLVFLNIVALASQYPVLSRRAHGRVFKALLIVIGYILLTIPIVQYPGSVVRVNFQIFFKAAVFFFFTAYAVDTPRRLQIALGVFIGLQVFRVLEPLFLNLTMGYWGDRTHLGGSEFANRLSGAPSDVINPNELGFVIVTVIPYLHYLLLPRGWLGRTLYLLILPALLYALILTMSRGAFLALLVVGVMIFRESRYKLPMIGVFLMILVVGWMNLNPVQKDRYLSLVGMSDSGAERTSEGRILGMIDEFQLGLRRPIVGHGLGTTPEAKYHVTGRSQASHSLYAQLLIELGLVGGAIFMHFLYRIHRSLRELGAALKARGGGSGYAARLNNALTAVFFMYAVYSINYWGLSNYYWYLFGGLVFSFDRIVRIQARIERTRKRSER